MNQRSLAVLAVIPASAVNTALTTNTTSTAVDIGVGSGTGYANTGVKEIKALGHVLMGSGNTSVTITLQDNTTSLSTDAGWANITNGAFTALTTAGELTPIHFLTNKRYIRAVSTLAGTTLSAQPVVDVLLFQRAV